MSSKNFFTIVLKVLGIIFIKSIIDIFLELFSSFLYAIKSDSVQTSMANIAIVALLFLVYFVIDYILLFRTSLIIDKLNLEQGLGEGQIINQFSAQSVFTIAILTIAGLVLINEVPNMVRFIANYVQQQRLMRGQYDPDISYLIAIGSKVLIALLLIGERKRLVAFIASKDSEKPADQIPDNTTQ